MPAMIIPSRGGTYWQLNATGRWELHSPSGRVIMTLREDASPNHVLYFGGVATGDFEAIALQVKGAADGNADPRIVHTFGDQGEWVWSEYLAQWSPGAAQTKQKLLEINSSTRVMTVGESGYGSLIRANQLISQRASAPGIAAGAGAGTSPTISLDANATDVSGTINLTVGTTPPSTVNTVVLTITFNGTYGVAPKAVCIGANSTGGSLLSRIYLECTTTTLVMKLTGVSSLTASTLHMWHYHVIQ